MRIGFVGIGAMGDGMARNLLSSGHRVSVWNRTPERAAPLAEVGAEVSADVCDVCKDAELVVSILADDTAMQAAILDSGFLEALPAGATHCSMATISVAMARRLVAAHAAAGRGYVSAPVFGRPPAAAAAKLFVVAAGAPDALARCREAFDAMGQRTFVVGDDPVAANVVKIGGNFMLASLIESLGESFALTRKYGIDPDQFLEILTGTIFPAPVYKNYGGMVAGDRYDPPGFKLFLGLKDVGLALSAAEEATVPMPIASTVRERFLTAIARGYSELDWAALGRVCAEDAGLPRRT